jgi:hypothetical protein
MLMGHRFDQFAERLDRLCYWSAGPYELEMSVNTTRPTQAFRGRWRFELSDEQCESLRNNRWAAVRAACGRSVNYYFAYPDYIATAEE